MSPDGRRVLFVREGTDLYRKGYRGSKAAQIWMYDLEDGTFTGNLTFMGDTELMDGTWSTSDGILTVTDASGTDEMPYSVSGDTLSITAPDDEQPGDTVLLMFMRQ